MRCRRAISGRLPAIRNQSALIPASLISLAMVVTRDFNVAACSSGVVAMTSDPRSKYCSTAAGVLRNRTISRFS